MKGATRGVQEEWMEGNLKKKILRLIPGLCLEDELVGKFKMAAGDMVCIRGRLWNSRNQKAVFYI